jgi:spore maturation protein CgeB
VQIGWRIRFGMKVLLVMGEYQYGDHSRGPGTESVAFRGALNALGHEVHLFDSWDRSLYDNYAELNRTLIGTVARLRPDILLSVHMNYEVWTETIDHVRNKFGVLTITWATDDTWKYVQTSRFLGSHYDVIVTTYEHLLPRYQADDLTNVHLSQWAANSNWLRRPTPAASCTYPVSFVGAAHGNRTELVKKFARDGIAVECFGHGWPNGPVSNEKMVGIFNESLISLNFANSSGENQIKARTFEIPGAGGFLLTQTARGLDRFFTIGKEIEIFGGIDELERKLRYFMAHPEERDTIANAGYDRVKQHHTYDQRMQDLLNHVLGLRQSRNSETRSRSSFEDACARHTLSWPLRALRSTLCGPAVMIFGHKRGYRAARRLLFELSWRVCGARTYSSAGWPGRLFPKS